MKRAIALLAAVAAAAAFVVWQSAGTTTLRPPGAVPVVSGATRGAGTAIGGGYRVAAGTRLIGIAFPQPPIAVRSSHPAGFTAVLKVDGAVNDVVDAYLRQARHLGLEPEAGSSVGRCESVTAPYKAGQREGPPILIQCRAYVVSEEGPSIFSLYLAQGDGSFGDGASTSSHLILSAVPGGTPKRQFGEPITGPTPTQPQLTAPERETIPRVGQTFGRDFVGEAVRVLPGSEAVMSPAYNGGVTGGYDMVLRVTGDPAKVHDAYVRQIHDITNLEAESTWRGRWRGMTIRWDYFDEAGGVKYGIETVTTGGASWMFLDVGND